MEFLFFLVLLFCVWDGCAGLVGVKRVELEERELFGFYDSFYGIVLSIIDVEVNEMLKIRYDCHSKINLFDYYFLQRNISARICS